MPFDIRKILRTPHSAVSRPCEISKICVPILLYEKTSTQKCPIQICKRCSFVPMWFSFEETEANIHQIRNTSYGLRMKMLLSHWKSSTTRNSIRNSSVFRTATVTYVCNPLFAHDYICISRCFICVIVVVVGFF